MDFSIIYVTAKALENKNADSNEPVVADPRFILSKGELLFIVLGMLISAAALKYFQG